MLRIPITAKNDARRALRERQKNGAGLTKQEADRLGINSGVERARQIIRNKSLPSADALRVAAFYQRFKHCNTPRCETAIDLWGGRNFGRKAVKYAKEVKR